MKVLLGNKKLVLENRKALLANRKVNETEKIWKVKILPCVAFEVEKVLKVTDFFSILSCIVLETLNCDVWVSQKVFYGGYSSKKKENVR